MFLAFSAPGTSIMAHLSPLQQAQKEMEARGHFFLESM